MSIAEVMQLLLGFGSFVLSFIGLVVVLIKLNDQKNNPSLPGQVFVGIISH